MAYQSKQNVCIYLPNSLGKIDYMLFLKMQNIQFNTITVRSTFKSNWHAFLFFLEDSDCHGMVKHQ